LLNECWRSAWARVRAAWADVRIALDRWRVACADWTASRARRCTRMIGS
jgi:hypothetical protein